LTHKKAAKVELAFVTCFVDRFYYQVSMSYVSYLIEAKKVNTDLLRLKTIENEGQLHLPPSY